MSGADHFFRGKLDELANAVDEYIKQNNRLSTGKKIPLRSIKISYYYKLKVMIR
ncbi:hypothetical protein OTSUT76_0027 [Orientia tsutsugamushi str. UT76]|nr:hypothetical protein OTSUT76_0027 [Orientia tsutsugamushi str. UT76]